MKRLVKKIKKYCKNIIGFITGVVVTLAVTGGIVAIQDKQIALAYSANGATIAWLPSTVTRYNSQIQTQAKKYNIDANLVAIIMTLESGGSTKADSGQAQGLMQITSYTAKDIAAKYLKKTVTAYDLFDAKTSIEFGTGYLAYLRDTFCDRSDGPTWNTCIELIAAGYNGGPGAANSLFKGEGLNDVQTATYSRNALNMWRERHADTSPTYNRWLEAGGQDLINAAKNK